MADQRRYPEQEAKHATRRFNDLVVVLQDAGMTQGGAERMVREYTEAIRAYDTEVDELTAMTTTEIWDVEQ